jgi:predicted Zn finger-like uncharacterized protein
VKTRCPTCNTRYDIPPQALLEADGVARCFRCGTVFETVSEDAGTPNVINPGAIQTATELDNQSEVAGNDGPQPPAPNDNAAEQTDLQSASPPGPQAANQASENTADRLPFVVPDNLEPLEPSPDLALDVADTLYQEKSYRGFYYGLFALLLAAGLGLQLAWQHRKELLQEYPILEPLCEQIECLPGVIHAPEKIHVLYRDIAPTANEPGSLTLSARIRNDADTAQSLPDIQLSLLDDNGAVMIRRRLAPAEYLFPPPPKGKLMAPGEVVTIALDFMDPGYQASGFMISFL